MKHLNAFLFTLIISHIFTASALGFTLDNPSLGDPNAPFTIQYFNSPECGHCKTFEIDQLPLLAPLIDSGRMRIIYRDTPPTLDLHVPLSRSLLCMQVYENFAERRALQLQNSDPGNSDPRPSQQYQRCLKHPVADTVLHHNLDDFNARQLRGFPAFVVSSGHGETDINGVSSLFYYLDKHLVQ